MSRVLDPTLAAQLASRHFAPWFKCKVYRWGALNATLDVLKYRLTGTHLSVTVRGLIPVSTEPEDIKLVLQRGVLYSAGAMAVPYVVESSKFTPIIGTVQKVSTRNLFVSTSIEADLIQPIPVTIISGGHSYRNVITDFCTALGKTAVFKNTGAAYWDYQFHPNDSVLTLNNAKKFLPMLWQKYLIFCCDNGNEEVLFYNALEIPAAGWDAEMDPVTYELGTGYFQRRRFFATDENGTVRFAGTPGDTLFNLGFIKSTDSLPTVFEQAQPISFDMLINLAVMDGDFIAVDGHSIGVYPAHITESFDPNDTPGWKINVKQFEYFTNTEGGPLPPDMAMTINYLSLDVSNFNHILNSGANNIQSAMDMLDDHAHINKDILGGTSVIPAIQFETPGQTLCLIPYMPGFSAAGGWPISRPGTMKGLYIRTNGPQSNTGTWVFCLQVDQTDTAIGLTIPINDATQNYSDIAHSVHFNAGQLIRVRATNNATVNSNYVTGWSLAVEYD